MLGSGGELIASFYKYALVTPALSFLQLKKVGKSKVAQVAYLGSEPEHTRRIRPS